jgi:hypothetical protein
MAIKKVPTDHSEVDRVLTEWFKTHHILAKDVRAYVIDRRIGQPEVLTLEIYPSDVDKIGPLAVQQCQIAGCPRAFGHTGKCWPPGDVHPAPGQERIDLTGWSEEEINELHRTGVPPESRR